MSPWLGCCPPEKQPVPFSCLDSPGEVPCACWKGKQAGQSRSCSCPLGLSFSIYKMGWSYSTWLTWQNHCRAPGDGSVHTLCRSPRWRVITVSIPSRSCSESSPVPTRSQGQSLFIFLSPGVCVHSGFCCPQGLMGLVPPSLTPAPEKWEHLGGFGWGRVGSTGAGDTPPHQALQPEHP